MINTKLLKKAKLFVEIIWIKYADVIDGFSFSENKGKTIH